jgi:hypothetical protein
MQDLWNENEDDYITKELKRIMKTPLSMGECIDKSIMVERKVRELSIEYDKMVENNREKGL